MTNDIFNSTNLVFAARTHYIVCDDVQCSDGGSTDRQTDRQTRVHADSYS